ncbi:MAG: TonB-dependent receptor plug domain-containing protein [Hyphomonadaceae bacterium]|nr:TonB-dependent receptor plug domain-containing protein [Hyphomonadaceae bacterium]
MKTTFLAGLFAGLSLPLYAQVPTESGEDARVFTLADFEQFAPRSAADMIAQIPGFTITGSDGQRGFGQAQENVLINGQRISSKSTSARQVLSRIPATNVERIEIVEGASLDIPGLSGQVANVIATANGISGTWTYRHRYRENLPPALDWLELSVNGQAGTLGWTVGIETEPNRGAAAGRENITDGNGDLIEYREEDGTFIADFVGLNGSLNWKPANGHIANLNAEYNLWEPDERETSSVFSPDGTLLRQTVFQFKENEWNSEISGDYELDAGPGRLKLIGLQRNEYSPTRAKFFGADLDGNNLSNQVFDRQVDESESILRGEYNLSGANNSDWQFSLEGAFNTLESEAQLFQGDTFDSVTQIDMGNPNIRVEEKRAEAFVTHGRQLSKDLRLQVSLGAEQSEIMSDGANSQTRNFTRPKGSASLSWTMNEKTTVNASVERQVGQLNFFDFVSNVDLNQGDDQTGNVDIVPDQRWRLALEVERDFGDWGAVTAEVFGDQIEDLVDQVPIGLGEGPGNIDDASRVGLEIEGTLKFDKLGWSGAQLDFETFLQDTFLDDPLTGETRDFNNNTIYYYELNFRHDIPNTNWAWGFNYEAFDRAPAFRRDVRRYFHQPQGFAWGFIEHKDVFGMTGSIFFANLLDSDDNFQRIVYVPDRTGVIDRIEDRSRNFGGILTLRLQGSF